MEMRALLRREGLYCEEVSYIVEYSSTRNSIQRIGHFLNSVLLSMKSRKLRQTAMIQNSKILQFLLGERNCLSLLVLE